MAQPSVKGVGTAAAVNGGTSIASTLPGGGGAPAANDIIVSWVTTEDNVAVSCTDFTAFSFSPLQPTTGEQFAIAWKRAVGGDGNPTWTRGVVGAVWITNCLVIQDCKTTGDPFSAVVSALTSGNAGTLVPGEANTLILMAGGLDDDQNTSGYANATDAETWTEQADDITALGTDVAAFAATAPRSLATTMGALTFTPAGGNPAGACGIAFVGETEGGGTTLTGAGAISSAESFGVARLLRVLNQGAGGIISRESFGTTRVARLLTAAGIPSQEAFGSPKVLRVLGALGVASQESFGQATVSFFSDIERAGRIASQEAFGVANIIRVLAGDGISSAESFGNSNIIRPLKGVGGIPSLESFGPADLYRLLAAGGIPSGESFGGGRLLRVIFARSISTGESFGLATVSEFDPGAGPVLGKVFVSDQRLFDVIVVDGGTWVVSVRDIPLYGVDVGDQLGG